MYPGGKYMNTNPIPTTNLPAYVNSYSYTIKVSCKGDMREVENARRLQELEAVAIAKIAKQLEANAPLPHAPGCGCDPCYW